MHYPSAPILEAIIDLRVSRSELIGTDEIQAVADSLSESYTHSGKLVGWESTIHVDSRSTDHKSELKTHEAGLRLSSKSTDPAYVATIRHDGLGCIHIGKYTRWENLFDQAQYVWKAYQEIVQPERITRIATRFINRIDIPVEEATVDAEIRYEDYVTVYPTIPNSFQFRLVSGYFSQVHFPQNDLTAILTLNTGLVPPPREGVLSVLLDFDLFSEAGWETMDAAWDVVNKFRDRKNEVFEASITDKARGLFE